jgi:hypothetical protein
MPIEVAEDFIKVAIRVAELIAHLALCHVSRAYMSFNAVASSHIRQNSGYDCTCTHACQWSGRQRGPQEGVPKPGAASLLLTFSDVS